MKGATAVRSTGCWRNERNSRSRPDIAIKTKTLPLGVCFKTIFRKNMSICRPGQGHALVVTPVPGRLKGGSCSRHLALNIQKRREGRLEISVRVWIFLQSCIRRGEGIIKEIPSCINGKPIPEDERRREKSKAQFSNSSGHHYCVIIVGCYFVWEEAGHEFPRRISELSRFISREYHLQLCLNDFAGFVPFDGELDRALRPFMAHTNPYCMYVNRTVSSTTAAWR